MQLTTEQRALQFPDGIRTGHNQIRLNLKRLGNSWQEVLLEVLEKMG